jgi:pyridoxamine 5'-phosphate oxidase
MAKVDQLFWSRSSEGADKHGSGGGGPVEAVFWMAEAKTQWRITGDAFVIGPDIDDLQEDGVKLAREKIMEKMRVLNDRETRKWSWSRELTFVFGAQSPIMRGTRSLHCSDLEIMRER